MLICGIDVAGKVSRPNGGLPDMQVTRVERGVVVISRSA